MCNARIRWNIQRTINLIVEVSLKNSSNNSTYTSLGAGHKMESPTLFPFNLAFDGFRTSRHKLTLECTFWREWKKKYSELFFKFRGLSIYVPAHLNFAFTPFLPWWLRFLSSCANMAYHVLYSLFIIIYVLSTSWSKRTNRKHYMIFEAYVSRSTPDRGKNIFILSVSNVWL